MDSTRFVVGYGEVVKVVSNMLNFFVEKQYVGSDGKFGLEDVGALIGQLVPAVALVDDFKVLIEGHALFLDPTVKPLLQGAFEQNFDLKNKKIELVVEEVHDIIFSVIKIVIKLKNFKEPV